MTELRLDREFAAVSPDRKSEAELLIRAAAVHPGRDAESRLEDLARTEIDWGWVLWAAEDNRITPMLHRSLSRICWNDVPESARSRLSASVLRNAAYNRRLVETLHELLSAAHEVGIPAIPFKGPVLASDVYGDVTLRQCWDLDLLVAPRHYAASRRLLVSRGYRPTKSMEWEFTVCHVRTEVTVDVHRAFAPRYFVRRMAFQELWDAVEFVPLQGRPVPNLSPRHLLAILCCQVAKDYSEGKLRLSKVCDVAELLRSRCDQEWVLPLGAPVEESMLNLCLILVRDLLGATLPADLDQGADLDDAACAAARQVARNLFAEERPIVESPEYLGGRRLRDRARYTFFKSVYDRTRTYIRRSLMPTDGDRELIRLPRQLSILYLLIRPVRLAFHAVRRPQQFAKAVLRMFRL